MKKGDQLTGDVAFKLYDTYGFPLDLTEDALAPAASRVDTDGFDAAMEKQTRRSAQVLGRLGRGRQRSAMVRGAGRSRPHRIPRL